MEFALFLLRYLSNALWIICYFCEAVGKKMPKGPEANTVTEDK